MSCIVTYKGVEMSEDQFIDNYVIKNGDIIEYEGVEYEVYESSTLGSYLVRGEEEQLSLWEDGWDAATERISLLNSIPLYNLNPVGDYTVVLGNIDPIFDIPLTALLSNGFIKTEKKYDTSAKSPFGGSIKNLDFQLEGMPASKASKETLVLLQAAANKMGVSIEVLADYAKSTGLETKGIAGVADLMRGVIAIAQGKENVATTEELVHISTAILEQTDPQLVTSMISKIDRFKIYKKTLDAYSKKKEYQLPNGKPNIRKIKKEAVDKLIAELIVYNSEGSTEFPELMEQENRSLVQSFWDTILDYIRGIYGKTNIDIFQTASEKVITGEVGGTVEDIDSDEVFFQVENSSVDKIYDRFMAEDKKLKLIPAIFDALGKLVKKRHYSYDGADVATTVTEKTKGNVPYERTDAQKIDDDMKKDWGSEGHAFLDKYISSVWIDKATGYRKDNPTYTKISSKLNPDIQERLEGFADKLIKSYPPGTKFLLEKKVVNTKVTGMIASTVDFAAIIPQEDGSAKLDILDWKFTGIDTEINDDIPPFKLKEWNAQMNEYVYIANTYGIKRENIRQARMIPFVANYSRAIAKDKKSPLVLTSLKVGDPVNQDLNSMFTLPVPSASELTGNPAIDRLLEAFRVQYEKLYKSPRSPEEFQIKKRQLVQLGIAIRSLHVKLDFAPLASVADTFIKNAKKTLDSFENINYFNLSADELNVKLQELLSYENSAKKFTGLDKAFLSEYPLEGMSVENRKTLKELEQYSAIVDRMLERILDLQREYLKQLAVKEEVVTEETKETVLDAEREIKFLARTFREGTQLASKIIKLASRLILNSKSLVSIRVGRMIDDFKPLLLDLEKEAASRGVSAFSLIGTATEKGLKLIKKIDSKFWEDLSLAKDSKDKEFILENVNIDEYNALADAAVKKGIEEINNTTYFSSNKDQNYEIQQLKIKQLRDSLELSRPTFNGYNDYLFGYFFSKTMKDEIHFSKEYKDMIKSPAAKNVWDFFTMLNERARKAGYLEREGNSFFPLVEASLLQKIEQSGDLLGQSMDALKDLYTATTDEEQGFSKIDPETNKIKKSIPKYFKNSKKSADQLSRDLNKVGTLWIKTLLNYENSKKLENTLLTLSAVERAKGSIIVEGDSIVFDGEKPRVDTSVNKNADILDAIIDDEIYGASEDITSTGNVGIGTVIGKFAKSEESKQDKVVSVKKVLKNSDILVRALAVGLKPLISIANAFGVNFQAYINAGRNYRYREFLSNTNKIVTGAGLTTEEKALLHLVSPLNEDVSLERRREIAKEKSISSWLGTWSFTDVMMSTNAFPERRFQYANAMSFNDNSMVMDGKIVNIRQYLKKQDMSKYKTTSEAERRELENTFEARVAELKEKSGLVKQIKIEGNQITIEGVSDEELAKYRVAVIEYGRNLNGQMNSDNKAGYRRDTIFSSFMMFKTWIPKQVILRTTDIQKNLELDNWEYGRTRAFLKTWNKLGTMNIMKMKDIINGTDEGLRILDEMLEAKREDHFKKTGEKLTITDEEFYDLMRTELTNQMKELQLLFGMVAVVMAAGAAIPDDDETLDDATRNRYKYLMKAMNKIEDELSFYYKPTSMESITKGSILPAIGLFSKAQKIIDNTLRESIGYVTDDTEMMDKAHPIKNVLNIIPGLAQFQSDALPLIAPDVYKDLGNKFTVESRQR